MTVSPTELAMYAGALFVLFLTPGPVWVALAARTLTGGFRAAWPLALGVAVGDSVWPLLAVLGVSWLVAVFSGFMTLLKWVAVLIFIGMGALILLYADGSIESDSRLTRPGIPAGFMAGIAVIVSNPKAALFYMGVLPGFFDLSGVIAADIIAIVVLSVVVPFVGNLMSALLFDRVRRLLASPVAVRRTNIVAGCLLVCVGLAIAAT